MKKTKRPTMIVSIGERVNIGGGGLPRCTYKCDDGKTYTRKELCAATGLNDDCLYRRINSGGLDNPTIFLPIDEYLEAKKRKTEAALEERKQRIATERERCRQERINSGGNGRIFGGAITIDRPRHENLLRMRPLGSWEREQLARENHADR
ncbi:MAG: hypothetical protein J0652_02675 [Desulfobulbaceae bacterium]|nr:hypothetical protein [Desulfobulbaceae bacterium]